MSSQPTNFLTFLTSFWAGDMLILLSFHCFVYLFLFFGETINVYFIMIDLFPPYFSCNEEGGGGPGGWATNGKITAQNSLCSPRNRVSDP